MTVYLLHLDQPLPRGVSPAGKALQAGHYIGWTDDLIGRMMAHSEGKGARLTQVCVERGINFRLARTWDGMNRRFERMLKTKIKRAPWLCPICTPNALNHMRLENMQ
jgi:hypothetical protein